MSGRSNGKIREITGHAASVVDHRVCPDVGDVHDNPRLVKSATAGRIEIAELLA
jgi:hypothetical protein